MRIIRSAGKGVEITTDAARPPEYCVVSSRCQVHPGPPVENPDARALREAGKPAARPGPPVQNPDARSR
jgi:hypothetical protein